MTRPTRAQVVAEAREWIGTRWCHQAAVKGVGTDCVGLIGGVALQLGLPDAQTWAQAQDLHNYGRDPDPTMLLREAAKLLDPVYLPEVRAGDILLLRFEREPQHFAIVSEAFPSMMIHAYAQARRVVECNIDAVWRSRIVKAFAYRGLEP